MSTIFKCKDGDEHDFDSNEKSEYCAKGCGEKWAIYAIKKLGADLKEKDAAVEQLKADLRTSDLNRQSLWADSVKMADELNYLKAKTDTEIHQLKSKLKNIRHHVVGLKPTSEILTEIDEVLK